MSNILWMFLVALYFTVCVLKMYLHRKVPGNIRQIHGLKLGLGLVPSYYTVIAITIRSA